MEPGNSQPYILWFKGEIEEHGVSQQLFIVVEQHMMLETNSLMSAVFGCMAAHYIFNLSYQDFHSRKGYHQRPTRKIRLLQAESPECFQFILRSARARAIMTKTTGSTGHSRYCHSSNCHYLIIIIHLTNIYCKARTLQLYMHVSSVL